MHPAFSVITFTVSSGAGLGLLILTMLMHLLLGDGNLTRDPLLIATGLGLLLTTIGLLSSTQHLANPKNAWRAFSRFRTSWLSREGICAVLLYPVVLLYLFLIWNNATTGWGTAVVAFIVAVVALATLFTTGMIYACLRTIPQWNNALVPANYLLLGLASGALILQLILIAGGAAVGPVTGVALGLLTLAALGKSLYFVWIGSPHSAAGKRPGGPTINTATGFTRANVKLFDIGHSGPSFNTREFGFSPSAGIVLRLRYGVFALAFAIPLVCSFWVTATPSLVVASAAVAAMLVGLFIERWLFFAEARHSVNLFHGQQHC